MDATEPRHLVEKKEKTLVKIDGSSESIRRLGCFLRYDYFLNRNLGHPFFPPMQIPCTDRVSYLSSEVNFKGWPTPSSHWKKWVEKLRPVHQDIWKKAGIFDAIQVSTCKIQKDKASIWEVLLYWSCETNTFVFPFGEASISLEDIMILGGFSSIGVCVRGAMSLTEELEVIKLHLSNEHRSFYKTKAKKPSFSAWMKHFQNCNDDSREHIAFLSLWLSRYVFPNAPKEVVCKEVFPIAILMAQGERFALGPAVLASLYRDMRLLKEYLTSGGLKDVLELFAPFQIVQMWVWEHFVSARKDVSPKSIDEGKQWATRWHDLSIDRIPNLGLICQSHDFQWRTYAKKLDNWNLPSYYNENDQWISGNDVNDEGIISFAHCLRACELVGMDSIQLYLPQRISRQFGYDQDLIGCARVDVRVSDWQLAWANYKKNEMTFMLYIPPRDFEADVTHQYRSWWKKNISSSSFFKWKRKKQELPFDLNTIPLDLNEAPLDLDEFARCSIKNMKRITRTGEASSSAALVQTQPTHAANEEATVAAPEKEDGHHRSENTEQKALSYEINCGCSQAKSDAGKEANFKRRRV